MAVQQDIEAQPYSLKEDLKATWELIKLAFALFYLGCFVLALLLSPFLYYSGAGAEIHAWFNGLWQGLDAFLRENPKVLLGVPFALLFALAFREWVKEGAEKFDAWRAAKREPH
ncbi:hypothetical protein [Methylobacterium sp. SD21]|uniref:hypothetical protein n=1 Tax=Methylobacterium litchii TaxID=3138810 RepID=UPI00313D3222